MGQNTYTEWFINTMLGWIRWIANGIASMFQSNSSRGSMGGSLLGWFSQNWIALLLVMIVLGVVLDWVVWMIRWRPYWLWFRKKRVLLDDDIDAILSDEELMRRFAPPRPKAKPHFTGSPLGRGGRPIPKDELTGALYAPDELDPDYDEEFDLPDIDIPYDDDEGDDDEYNGDDDDGYADYEPSPIEPDEPDNDDDIESDEPFDQLYNDAYHAVPYDADDGEALGEADEDEPDIGFLEASDDDLPRHRGRRHKRPGWLQRLRDRRPIDDGPDDDPFSVDDAEFYDPEDDADFLHAISGVPSPTLIDPDQRATPGLDVELSDELTPSPRSAADPTPTSRRARRQRREYPNDQ